MRSTLILLVVTLAVPEVCWAVISWDDDGGSADKRWSNPLNWDSDTLPYIGEFVVISSADAENDRTLLDSSFRIGGLTLSSGADVVTSPDLGVTNYELQVDGTIRVYGDSNFSETEIALYSAPPNGESLDAVSLELHPGGQVRMLVNSSGGPAPILESENLILLSPSGNKEGGRIEGHGLIRIDAEPLSPETLFINAGRLVATAQFPNGGTQSSTLQIVATHPNTRIELDGFTEVGQIEVDVGATLDVDVPLADPFFNSNITLKSQSILDIQDAWGLDTGGVVDVHAGAGAARIAGAGFSLTGGAINLSSGSDALDLDLSVLGVTGAINNSGHIIFHENSSIGQLVAFTMTGGSARLTVAGDAAVSISTNDFNLDGNGTAGNTTTIGDGGALNLSINFDIADDEMNQPIILNGGRLDVVNSYALAGDKSWQIMAGSNVVTVNAASHTSQLSGDDLQVLGRIDVNAGANLNVDTTSTIFDGSADINVAAGATLNVNGPAKYVASTVSITGSGLFRPGNAEVGTDSANTADIVWATATVDFDDGNHVINAESSLTINAAAVETSVNDGADNTMTIHEGGLLTINLAGGAAMRWDSGSKINYQGNADNNVFLGASATGTAHEFAGALNVTGFGSIAPDMEFNGSNVAVGTGYGSSRLELNGHTTYQGGNYRGDTIQQDGDALVVRSTTLGANTFMIITPGGGSPYQRNWLQVFDWDGFVGAGAETTISPGATFTINAVSIESSTSDGYDGTINVNGGTLFVNTGARIEAPPPNLSLGTVVPATVVPAPWRLDGTMNLRETNGNTALVASQYGSALQIYGEVHALQGESVINGMSVVLTTGGRVHVADGASLAMNVLAGGTIDVDSGGLYRLISTSTLKSSLQLNIDGAAEFAAHVILQGGSAGGAGTLNVMAATDVDETTQFQVATEFVAGSTTTIATGKELQLASDTLVESGATFTGDGVLHNLAGSKIALLDGANLGVTLINDGVFSPEENCLEGFEQSSTGVLRIELDGTSAGDFDRIMVHNSPQLAGMLEITLGTGFEPMPGDSFQILLTENLSEVVGSFDNVDANSMISVANGTGLFLVTNNGISLILSNFVSGLQGDYNSDDFVDAADYTVWRDALGQSGTGLAADGNHDGLVSGLDYEIWRSHFGSSLAAVGNRAASVPEPDTWTLLGLLSLSMAYRRRAVGK